MGGDLAHAGQHFDVAVGEGADAGGECLGAGGQLSDSVLQSAEICGQVGGVTQGSECLVQ